MAKTIQMKDINNTNYYPNVVYKKTTNDNGTAIQYADGTLICYGKKTLSYSTNDMWSWCDRTSQLMVPFPISFKEVPTVNISSNTFTIIGVNLSSIETSKFNFYGFQPKNCGTTLMVISYIAIGNWK